MKLQTCYVVGEDTIEKTELLMPTRPFMDMYGGLIATWVIQPEEGDLIEAFRLFKQDCGLVPLDHHSRQTILLPPMMRSKLLKDLNIASKIINDLNQINRLGKLFAFTSEAEPYDIELAGTTWSSKDRDGTVLISSKCPGPRQVRALVFTSNGQLSGIVKGIIRPPIGHEPEGFVGDAQFGTPIQAGMVMRIYEVSSLAPQRASLNWQAAVFNYDSKSIGRALRKDQENLDKLTVIDCVPKEHREKCFYGIPAGLLINQLGPWKSLRKLRCGIARLPVFELEDIPLGSFAIGDATRIELQDDAFYPILRDPAKSDRSAIQNYLFHGYIFHFHGIFFNPKEPLWKLQGGDFDGDYGIILRPEMLKQLSTLPTKTRFIAAPRTMPIVNNKPVYESALLSRLSSAENMIGAVVLEAIRRFEIGQLNDERAIALAEICQASIDAIKHSRDNMAIRRAFKTITDEREGEFEFFVDQVAKITQATGFDDKKLAWKELGQWITAHPAALYHEQFSRRYKKLDTLLEDTGFLRGSRLQIPDVLKDMCNAHLLSYDSTEEVTLMKELAKAYRDSVKAAGTALTDEQTEAAQEVISQCKSEITEAYINRQVSTAALLAYCPPRLAAELVDVEELKQLRITSNSTVLAINLPIESRIYPVDEPQPCSPLDYQAFVGGYSQVRITVLETKDTYARCFLEVNQSDSIPFDPSQFADDDDIFA